MKIKASHLIMLTAAIVLTVALWQDDIDERAYYHPDLPPIPISELLYRLLVFYFPLFLAIFYGFFYGAYFVVRESIKYLLIRYKVIKRKG